MWLGVWGLASANKRVVHAAIEQQASDPQVSLSGVRCDFVGPPDRLTLVLLISLRSPLHEI